MNTLYESLSFGDMLKKSVLEGFNTEITVTTIVLSLAIALVAGVFVLFIRRMTRSSAAFSVGFELALVMLSVVSALIVLTITSNLALSLGMVGALSIVRFRTAVKDPSDTAFMFWAVAVGITAGAGFYWLCIIGSLFVGLITFISAKLIVSRSGSYLLVVRADDEKTAEYINKFFEENSIRASLSSMNYAESYEMIYEVSLKKSGHKLVNVMHKLPGVTEVSLIDCKNTPV